MEISKFYRNKNFYIEQKNRQFFSFLKTKFSMKKLVKISNETVFVMLKK